MVASTLSDLVCLQEMKKEAISRRMVLSMLGAEFEEFIMLPAGGTCSGILLAWRRSVCQHLNSRIDSFSLLVQFTHDEGDPWWFTGVYGPQSEVLKIQFLEELCLVRQACTSPWIVGGNFNLIYQAADKNNSNLDREMMGRFCRFINDVELYEIPLLRGKFTWSNEREASILVWLN
jgi:exonuclease III